VSTKYGFICSEEGHYPIVSMCRWAKVSASGYYDWRGRPASATELWRDALGVLIEWLFNDSDATYGYRRIHASLARLRRPCDPHTVRSIMRDRGLVAAQPRRQGPKTTISSDAGTLPDLVKRDFTATVPGTKLVGDITYIDTWQGWVYLATVLDCCTKKVVGYAMADHMRTSLVVDALAMAVKNGHTTPEVTIFHSDRGTQGGFNWSSQHLDLEVCDGASTADGGSGGAAEVEVAGASVSAAGRGAGVLAPDRGRVHQRGCCRGGRRVGAGRVAVVPARWRHATVESERPVGPLPVVR